MITKIQLNKALKTVGFIIISLLIWFILLLLLLSSNEVHENKINSVLNHTETIQFSNISNENKSPTLNKLGLGDYELYNKDMQQKNNGTSEYMLLYKIHDNYLLERYTNNVYYISNSNDFKYNYRYFIKMELDGTITIIESEDIESLDDIEQLKMNEYNKVKFM